MDVSEANEPFQMVLEAVDSYRASDLPDGRLEIRIVVPRRFASLWLVKLNDLVGTMAEVDDLNDEK